jgi:hypothetical protein
MNCYITSTGVRFSKKRLHGQEATEVDTDFLQALKGHDLVFIPWDGKSIEAKECPKPKGRLYVTSTSCGILLEIVDGDTGTPGRKSSVSIGLFHVDDDSQITSVFFSKTGKTWEPKLSTDYLPGEDTKEVVGFHGSDGFVVYKGKCPEDCYSGEPLEDDMLELFRNSFEDKTTTGYVFVGSSAFKSNFNGEAPTEGDCAIVQFRTQEGRWPVFLLMGEYSDSIDTLADSPTDMIYLLGSSVDKDTYLIKTNGNYGICKNEQDARDFSRRFPSEAALLAASEDKFDDFYDLVVAVKVYFVFFLILQRDRKGGKGGDEDEDEDEDEHETANNNKSERDKPKKSKKDDEKDDDGEDSEDDEEDE